MKTLDEVIKALCVCGRYEHAKCPYFDSWNLECCNPGDLPLVFDDALHYLKEYRDYRNHTETEIKSSNVPGADNKPLSEKE